VKRIALAVVLGLAACSGHGAPAPSAPQPQVAAVPAVDSGKSHPGSTSAAVPATAPQISFVDSASLRRAAEDSAADEEILERLAAAHPEGTDTVAETEERVPAPMGPKATPATWDIDVASYNAHARVQYYLDFFQGYARDRMAIWLTRMPRYETMIRTKFRAAGLPADLVYLALIESGYSNSAVSRSRAVGMWQFMKGTARLYGLRVDRWVDERRDPYKATEAAVRFLSDLRDRFGSPYLAAAAYNAGARKVQRGLARLPEDDDDSLSSDGAFFRLYDTRFLRRETKDYVPKLIAAALIAKEPERYGFIRPDTVAIPLPDSILVPDATGLDVVARLADTTVTAIRELNPQFLRSMTPPKTKSVVRVPAGTGPMVAGSYATLPSSQRITFVEHYVAKGETVGAIAKMYGVSSQTIQAANPGMQPRALRVGQRLVIPKSGTMPSREVMASVEDPAPRRAGSAATHRVKQGETLSGIAYHYRVTVSQLREWNGLDPSDVLKSGQQLRVTAPKAVGSTPKGVAESRISPGAR
jgi:membrane-bound lytic murein transglycosylase D